MFTQSRYAYTYAWVRSVIFAQRWYVPVLRALRRWCYISIFLLPPPPLRFTPPLLLTLRIYAHAAADIYDSLACSAAASRCSWIRCCSLQAVRARAFNECQSVASTCRRFMWAYTPHLLQYSRWFRVRYQGHFIHTPDFTCRTKVQFREDADDTIRSPYLRAKCLAAAPIDAIFQAVADVRPSHLHILLSNSTVVTENRAHRLGRFHRRSLAWYSPS